MAEEILGEAFRASPALKDKVEIVTKCDIVVDAGRHAGARVKHYDTSRPHIEASVEASLRLMGIDRIDLLLIHRPDPLMDHLETGAALDALVASGKVRAVGVSNFRPWDVTLLQSGMKNRLCTNQIELSLVAHQGFTNGDVAFHQQHQMPLMAWSPLAGGRLLAEASKELRARLAQIGADHGTDWGAAAVAWLLRHPARIIPVLGTNSLSRIGTIATAMDITMDRQTWFELYTLILGHEVA
jgi:predicted oxidoreductase